MSRVSSLLKKGVLLGLGIAAITEKRFEKKLSRLMKEGEVSEKDARELLKSVMSAAKKQGTHIQSMMSKHAELAIKKSGLVSKSELEKLKKHVKGLEARVKARAKVKARKIIRAAAGKAKEGVRKRAGAKKKR